MSLPGRPLVLLHRASFRRQISVLVAAGMLLLSLTTSLAISWQSSREIRLNRQQQGEKLASILAGQVQFSLLVDSSENAADALIGALAFPDVLRVEVRHLLNGRLLMARSANGAALAVAAEAPPGDLSASVFLEAEDGEAWRFVAPVRTTADVSPFLWDAPPRETLGYVRIVLAKASLNQSLFRVFALNLGLALLFTLLFLLLIRGLSIRMMRPLQQLTRIMERAQEDSPAERAALSGPSDVVSMAHAFNRMMTVIDDRERSLRERDKALGTILDTSLDGFCCIDLQGNLLDINPAYCQQSGYRREELLGTNVSGLLPNKSDDVITAQARQIAERGKGQFEATLRRKDGAVWHAEMSVTYHDFSGGQFFVFVRDITERKRAEGEISQLNADLEQRILARTADYLLAKERAEAADRAKTRFLAAASHDLRQPIQALSLFVDALQRTELSAHQKHIGQCLFQSAASLGELLSALLDISKLDAGIVEPSFQAVSVEKLFVSIEAGAAAMANEKKLRFKLFFPFGEMAVVTDGRLLISLLNNLIGNALKYTAQGGILVGLRRRGNQALIQVWDTGVGIDPGHRSRIFEEYFQVANAARDSAKGLGLGLAIVQRLARLLETEVLCRSLPGKGSVFEFRLPMAGQERIAASSPMAAAETGVVPLAGLVGLKVVVVEDNPMVVGAVRLSLESFGMGVTAYANAEEALLNIKVADADFYFSDFRLPGMDGVQFLDAVQQRSQQPIKAALLTGDTSPARLEIARASRWMVLFKPVDLPGLLSAIRSQGPFR